MEVEVEVGFLFVGSRVAADSDSVSVDSGVSMDIAI